MSCRFRCMSALALPAQVMHTRKPQQLKAGFTLVDWFSIMQLTALNTTSLRSCLWLVTTLMTGMTLPVFAAPAATTTTVKTLAPGTATAAPDASSTPVRMPPVSGVNNSKTPTEIQVSQPGQPSYIMVIPPSKTPAKAPVPQGKAPACASMKAPYRAGLWEITSVSNNSLMPQPITAKIKRCVTERDAQNACGLNQLAGGRNRDCQLVDMQITSNTATWGMRCESPHFTAQGSGQSTFTADAYHGKFTMSASMQGSPMQMNTTFSGRRLGNCK